MPAPLSDLLVIDVTTSRAELAGRVLADLGATVLKLESSAGCEARTRPPFATASGDSLYWASVGAGKRSAVLDVLDARESRRVHALLARADVFIESFDPGVLAPLGLDGTSLLQRHPRLIAVSVSPFGQTGPKATYPTADLTLEAAAGLIGLQGDADRVPIPVGFPQAGFHAGLQAAADVLVALAARTANGKGQHLDVSMQAAVILTLMNATGYPPLTGANPPGTCEQRATVPPALAPGVVVPRIWRCADGWAVLGLHQPVTGERTFSRLMSEADDLQLSAAEIRGMDWSAWVVRVRSGEITVAQANAALTALAALMLTQAKQQWQAFAVANALLIAAAYEANDLLNDPQLAARQYWTHIGPHVHPGAFARLSATPIRLAEPAPSLGSHQSLLDELLTAEATSRSTAIRGATTPRTARDAVDPVREPVRSRADATPRSRALVGLKVADFAWVGVGPLIAKALADHGATVVHVESATRTDLLRHLPPFLNNEPGADRGQFHPNFNTSKLGLSLDLRHADGLTVARDLAHWADVVVESFTPGTLARYGIDYATLHKTHPSLVMLSTCMRGQTGPEARYAGFGNQGAALAGIVSVTGWPDRPPAGPFGAYTDFVAPRYGVAALLAALHHRTKTGEGQYIDLSQIEAGMHFIEPLLLDYTVNGRVPKAPGIDALHAVPHGVYACADAARHVAIAVETNAQWLALADLMAKPNWHAWLTLQQRRAQLAAINAALADWCATRTAADAADTLIAHAIPAHRVQWPTDLFDDAQLTHRGYFMPLVHPVMGTIPYDGLVTHFSGIETGPFAAGPGIGQHNEHVLRALLGYSAARTDTLQRSGALC